MAGRGVRGGYSGLRRWIACRYVRRMYPPGQVYFLPCMRWSGHVGPHHYPRIEFTTRADEQRAVERLGMRL